MQNSGDPHPCIIVNKNQRATPPLLPKKQVYCITPIDSVVKTLNTLLRGLTIAMLIFKAWTVDQPLTVDRAAFQPLTVDFAV